MQYKFATQLYTQVRQMFNADQVLRNDSTLVYHPYIVLRCCMPQLYNTLKIPQYICHKLNFRVYSVYQSAVWNCVVNACQTYVLQLYRILSQQLQLCTCCPTIILTSMTVYTPYTDHKYWSAHAYVISQLLYAATGTSGKVSLFVIVNNPCTQGRYYMLVLYNGGNGFVQAIATGTLPIPPT